MNEPNDDFFPDLKGSRKEFKITPPPGENGLFLVPTTLRVANDFVAAHHRHNGRTARNGGKWACGLGYGDDLIGVAIVGNPLSARWMDGWTAEVLRVCVVDDSLP